MSNVRGRLVPGLASLLLFGVLATTVLTTEFDEPAGFPEGEPIIHNIGYALFNLDIATIPAEGFLAAFLIIAVALDVAIDGAVYLARREDEASSYGGEH